MNDLEEIINKLAVRKVARILSIVEDNVGVPDDNAVRGIKGEIYQLKDDMLMYARDINNGISKN